MTTSGGPFAALSDTARAVMVELLVHGPASRADLARRARLSPASLTRIVRMLVEADLVSESDAEARQHFGRPPQPMDVNASVAHLIGIKVSTDRLDIVTTDLRARLLTERQKALPATDPRAVTDTIAAVVREEVARDATVCAVGVSLAGPVSPRSEVVHTSPFLGWTEVPLVAMIREQTGLPAIVENDVRALTAAEHWFGAAAGCSDFAVITIGTGVGCGIVANDRLLDGALGGSGQVGHLPITQWGPLCERGHRGCVRSYLASSSIVEQARAFLRDPTLDYAGFLDHVERGTPGAVRIADEAAQALGVLIGTVVTVTGPSLVIVSGEGVELASLTLDAVRAHARATQHWTMPEVPIEVVPFAFTEWARGAAVMALRQQLDPAIARTDA